MTGLVCKNSNFTVKPVKGKKNTPQKQVKPSMHERADKKINRQHHTHRDVAGVAYLRNPSELSKDKIIFMSPR